jgi:hypothetical protein
VVEIHAPPSLSPRTPNFDADDESGASGYPWAPVATPLSTTFIMCHYSTVFYITYLHSIRFCM